MRKAKMKAFPEREGDKGRHVFTFDELARTFPCKSRRTLSESLRRMVPVDLLHRARGICFSDQPNRRGSFLAERISPDAAVPRNQPEYAIRELIRSFGAYELRARPKIIESIS